MSPTPRSCRIGTDLLHADDEFHGSEVSPSISVSTSTQFRVSFRQIFTSACSLAFRQMDLSEHVSEDLSRHPESARDAKTYIYSRLSQGVRSRVERVLSEINVRTLMAIFW
jgi:cystathionine gamma-synthase